MSDGSDAVNYLETPIGKARHSEIQWCLESFADLLEARVNDGVPLYLTPHDVYEAIRTAAPSLADGILIGERCKEMRYDNAGRSEKAPLVAFGGKNGATLKEVEAYLVQRGKQTRSLRETQ